MIVKNKLGLHQRPAAMFVKAASKYPCEILVEKDGEEVNGKSILGMLTLAAGHGSTLRVTARGEEAERALRELQELVDNKFNEE